MKKQQSVAYKLPAPFKPRIAGQDSTKKFSPDKPCWSCGRNGHPWFKCESTTHLNGGPLQKVTKGRGKGSPLKNMEEQSEEATAFGAPSAAVYEGHSGGIIDTMEGLLDPQTTSEP